MKIIQHGSPVVISHISNAPCGMCPSAHLASAFSSRQRKCMLGAILAMEKETVFLCAAFWRLCREQYLYVTGHNFQGHDTFYLPTDLTTKLSRKPPEISGMNQAMPTVQHFEIKCTLQLFGTPRELGGKTPSPPFTNNSHVVSIRRSSRRRLSGRQCPRFLRRGFLLSE